MAVAVRSTATLAYGAARTSSAVPKPTGAASGDRLLVILNAGATGASVVTVTPPTGWSEVSGSPSSWTGSADNYKLSQRLFTRLADGTEGATFAFTHASADTEAICYAITGADATTPFSPSPSADNYGNHTNGGKTTNYGSLTTTAASLIIASEADWDATGTGTISGTTPTLSQRLNGFLLYVADGSQATAGATGARTRTNGNGSTTNGWVSFLIAVNPSSGAAAVTGTLAATESGSDTASAGGSVTVSGSLAATETGSDTAAASGAIQVSGSLAATESGSDTVAASGSVAVSGSLAASETGSDTAAALGAVGVSGALAAAEAGTDTAAGSGSVTASGVSGFLAATESGSDTATATGSVETSGTLAASEAGADAAAVSGTVSSANVLGTLAAMEAGTDVASLTGTVVVLFTPPSPDPVRLTGKAQSASLSGHASAAVLTGRSLRPKIT